MTMRDGLHQTLQQRVYGSIPADLLFKRARGSKYLLQCLQRNGTLTGHDGCVNTIVWSDSGDLLLSGSDDCRLNIYRPYQHKLLQSIRTGHRANIFSAKFLPCTSDKWIVSCAGDGMIQFTDLEKPESHGKCSYNCHAGTAYEVITTPGDPNTFISCGEDGTVRMFDIRTKSKCVARDCKEDILIDCGKAVTSIGINPLAPYQLGVGCEDSTVALFDRRSLSTANCSHGMKGMLCKFKPDALKDRACRVTSLQYSSDGCELLVSYCADYIYLFNTRGEKEVRLKCDSGHENGTFYNHDRKKNLPLKRLRLRGDWSDTGPNARPESEAASTESTLMQRMSDLFVRWIEESFRGNQRNRSRTASSQTGSEAASSSVTFPPSLPPRPNNESSSNSSSAVDHPEPSQDNQGINNQESTDESTDELFAKTASTSGMTKMEKTADQRKQNEKDEGENTSEITDCTSSNENNGTSGVKIEVTSPNIKNNKDKPEDSRTDNERYMCDNDSIDMEVQCVTEPRADVPQDVSETRGDVPQGVTETRGDVSQDVAETRGDVPQSVAETRGDVPQSVAETRGDVPQSVAETRGDVPQGVAVTLGNVTQGVAKTRGDVSQDVTVTRGDLPQGVAVTRGEVSPSPNTAMPSQEAIEHDLAATRIQRMFRNYKIAKHFAKCDGSCDGELSEEREVWIPKMTRVYRGHRNARTMIKEAKFWGDHYIISGSDCGRIFIWDKDTAEVVMILQGDRHVVNCVQPHPFDPILASSGIDYDIKLWAPTAETPLQIDGLDEIIKRNEEMLEESRDTITVPASFMLRMLASLNHARFARNQDDSDTDSNDDV